MSGCLLWLRAETKHDERRTPLIPEHAARLKSEGFKLIVESSPWRAFPDADYTRVGAHLTELGSWRQAPAEAVILGLKELPEDELALRHRHIYFAHAFKGQRGWEKLLGRFAAGGGLLLDLEHLFDDAGRRVAAFGRWAGYSGAAVGLDLWAQQQLSPLSPLPRIESLSDQETLLERLKPRLHDAQSHAGRAPRVIVLGAKGRCGAGALELLDSAGLSDVLAWDKEETASGGPFDEILRHDVLLNCALLSGPTKPFLTPEMLDRPRRLSVVSDVSCDPYSPHNPLPIYRDTTNFERPSLRIKEGPPPLDLTAIDNLPSFLPRESSSDFSSQLLPHLQSLKEGSPVWDRAAALFHEKCKTAREQSPQ